MRVAARLVACFALLGPTPAIAYPPPASSTLYGHLTSNATFTLSAPGPIYDIVGDLYVDPGVVLTIEPGVTVRFAANQDVTHGGSWPGLVELWIDGTLIADATSGDSIRFVSSNGGSAEWGDVEFAPNGSVLRRCALRNGIRGILGSGFVAENCSISALNTCFELTSPSVTINNCVIADAFRSILAVGGPHTLTNLQITSTREGVYLGPNVDGGTAGVPGGIFRNVTLRGPGVFPGWAVPCCATGLVIFSGWSTAPPNPSAPVPVDVSGYYTGVILGGGTATNVLSHDNVVGLQFGGGDGSVPSGAPGSGANYCTIALNSGTGVNAESGSGGSVRNSIVALSGGSGFQSDLCAGIQVDYCNVWANNGGCPVVGANNSSSDPMFVDSGAGNFRLAANSPVRNWSDSGGQVGAYGPGIGGATVGRSATWGSIRALYGRR